MPLSILDHISADIINVASSADTHPRSLSATTKPVRPAPRITISFLFLEDKLSSIILFSTLVYLYIFSFILVYEKTLTYPIFYWFF